MLTYPLHEADLGITQESIDAGKVNVVYNYKDLLSMVNIAFFNGFIVAMCDSKEEFEGIDVMDRILMCSAATIKLAKLQGRAKMQRTRRISWKRFSQRLLRKRRLLGYEHRFLGAPVLGAYR